MPSLKSLARSCNRTAFSGLNENTKKLWLQKATRALRWPDTVSLASLLEKNAPLDYHFEDSEAGAKQAISHWLSSHSSI